MHPFNTGAACNVRLRFVFDDGVVSFHLGCSPTPDDIASTMSRLALRYAAAPLAIDVTFTAAPAAGLIAGPQERGRGPAMRPAPRRVAHRAAPLIEADIPGGRDAPATIEGELVALLPQLARYARFLARNRADADDLLQDAVVRMLNAAHTYRPGTNFKAWACTVMRNRFLTLHVRGQGRTVNIDDVEPDHIQRPPSQLHRLEHQDLLDQFMQLPAESRSIIAQAGGMSYQQIARASGCAVGTVKSRVHRARTTLRSMLLAAYAPQGDCSRSASAREPSPPPRQR